jgi:2-succinyl-5-enolpyruvyl-6-hydroxy-3-cyclohexene-1-carboxylate synthase
MSVPTAPSQPDVQATFCATLVDEWARAGVTDAVVCPGSRSTPLAMALASDGRVAVHVRLDERSAAFFAIGAALATRRAVVICTTSGTAAAELHAGVVEAHHSCVPLLVCTADRPPRLHRVGAPQTIEQSGMFGLAVRFSASLGVARWEEREVWRSIAARAFAECSLGPLGPGPVHLDLAFDEPLLGAPATLPRGRDGGAVWHRVARPDSVLGGATVRPPGLEQVLGRRVLLLAGAGAGVPDAVLDCAQALGAPVVADPLSGCRRLNTRVVAAGDPILRSDAASSLLRPDVVIRVGAPQASRVVATRLSEWARAGTTNIVVDDRWRWADPERLAGTVIHADPSSWCESVTAYLAGASPEGVPEDVTGNTWTRRWTAAESAAQRAIDDWCERHPEATEPGVARAVTRALPADALLVVASSMPVRDLEWFAGPLDDPPRVLANRGANGIDGVVSTAMGAAAAVAQPVVALVGDLAFLHDLTALVRVQGAGDSATVVVVDNGGGGIFSFLPQRSGVPVASFEELFATPPATSVAAAARGLGAEVTEVSTIKGLEEALCASIRRAGASVGPAGAPVGRPSVSVVRPSISVVRVVVPGRDENVEIHDRINAEITARVEDALEAARDA